jgi:hypothetical protein
VYGLLAPIKQLYFDFLEDVRGVDYIIEKNGQVCYLRSVLNDSFDFDLRRIQIRDGNRFERLYIFTTSENKPKALGTIYLNQRSDFADSGVDFLVVVPLALKDLINEYALVSQVEFFKLASKRFKIIYE